MNLSFSTDLLVGATILLMLVTLFVYMKVFFPEPKPPKKRTSLYEWDKFGKDDKKD